LAHLFAPACALAQPVPPPPPEPPPPSAASTVRAAPNTSPETIKPTAPDAEIEPEIPAPIRATFLSTSSEQWNVAIDGQPACSTPCTLPLFPVQFVTLHSQEVHPVLLEVGRLPRGDVVVSGHPLDNGKYAGGIVATTFGGMAAVVGITLTAVGLAKDKGGMTTAGLITGAAGAIGIPLGIHLMIGALPRATVGISPPRTVGFGASGAF
jgi:hypothetical protein